MPPKKKSALVGTVFCISGSLSVPKKNMTDMLTGAGAEVSSSLTAKVTHVLTTDADVAKQTSKVVTAEQKGLPVVGESFVSACLKAGKQVNLAPHLLVAGVAAGKKAAGKKAAGKKAPPGPKKAITKKPPKKVTAKKSAKASAAAADAAGGATAPEPIETGKTVGASVATDDDTGQYLEYQLSQMDLAKNIDKFYIAQVLDCGPSSFYCVQHWGRTGTKGQVGIDGPFPGKDFAIASFEQKFKGKAGAPYAERRSYKPKAGKYRYKEVNYSRESEGVVMWQYWVDDGVDGKPTDWYDYFQEASDGVDAVFVEWQSNTWLDVRCIASGHWSYQVDFNAMTQTNVSTSRTRTIRRTVDGEADEF